MNKHELPQDPLLSEDLQVKRAELRELVDLYRQTIEGYEFLYDTLIGFNREHPDSYDYILFHDIVGSTLPPNVTKFDMPNHEIENLIINLPAQLNEKKKAA